MMLLHTRRTATRRRSTGQAMVELILVLPIFLVMLLGLIDVGRVIYAQNAIRLDAEAAARFASVSAPQSDVDIIEQAKRISPAVLFPNSAINNDGADPFYPNGTPCSGCVVVHIDLEVPILTPIISQLIGGSITVKARAEELIH